MDLFEFWAEIAPHEKVHPRDKAIIDRVNHGLDLRCLPACFDGPLRTAPVVLLYLSPGFHQFDVDEAETESAQSRYVDRRRGNRHLTEKREHEPAWRWRDTRTRAFGSWEDVKSRIAILNIGAYHSRTFVDEPLLAALPSSRAALDWAQSELFPQAQKGKRVVVCLRSARFWGLDKSWKHGVSLFAPPVTRSGHMIRGPQRDEVVASVKQAISVRAS